MSGMGLAGSSSVIRAAFLLELPGETHLLPFKRVIYFPAAPGCHLHLHPSAPGSFFHLQRWQHVIMALLPLSYPVQWLHWTDWKSPQYPPRLKVFTFITSAHLLPPEMTCSQALRDEDVDISGDRGSVHHTIRGSVLPRSQIYLGVFLFSATLGSMSDDATRVTNAFSAKSTLHAFLYNLNATDIVLKLFLVYCWTHFSLSSHRTCGTYGREAPSHFC